MCSLSARPHQRYVLLLLRDTCESLETRYKDASIVESTLMGNDLTFDLDVRKETTKGEFDVSLQIPKQVQ